MISDAFSLPRVTVLAAALGLLAACGGGGDGSDSAPLPGDAACETQALNSTLASYFSSDYFWAGVSPRPDPAAFTETEAFFQASLYTGTDPRFPADRYSGSQTSESFNRFYGEGESLGYGVSVAGLEVLDQPSAPLYVRYVEARSPAALAGVTRGDQVLALNGRSAADVVAANDFAALTATAEGQTLTMRLRAPGGAEREASLRAAVFALTPVSQPAQVSTAQGRRVAYVQVKDMISGVTAPLDAAFSQFRASATQDLVLDLRYNGGGLVSAGRNVASFAAAGRDGQVYAQLVYNAQQSARNELFRFSPPASALALPRVYLLMGQRTCSASEQLINGLQGVGVDVVTIGDTSCGKPVGFVPVQRCGRTYSVVNFESLNARGEGRYFDGFVPRCAVPEDFTRPQGQPGDPLLDAALAHADSGQCAAQVAAGRASPKRSSRRGGPAEPGEHQGMFVR
jgi:hypothetical protein